MPMYPVPGGNNTPAAPETKHRASKNSPERIKDNYASAVLLDDGMEHAKIHKKIVDDLEGMPVQSLECVREVVRQFKRHPSPDRQRAAVTNLKHELMAAEHEIAARGKPVKHLKWNKDNRPDENPAAFAWRAYAAEAKAGTLHRGVIGREDKPLAVKLASWLRTHDMPEGIDIPTKPEWITRQAEAGKAKTATRPRTEGQRIYDAMRQRQQRAVRHATL